MHAFFRCLGVVVAAYTLYSAWRGEVYARSGPGGRMIARAESPRYFWVVIAIYAGLTVALVTVF